MRKNTLYVLGSLQKILLFILLLVFVFPVKGLANNGYDGEYNLNAGIYWGFKEAINYEISNPNLAEWIKSGDKKGLLWLKKPGDLELTVTFRSKPGYKNPCRYLLHITGEAQDETAVGRNFAQEVLELVNKERAKRGSGPLKLAHDLNAACAIRAQEITRKFSHTRPNGSKCFTVMKNLGRGAGENIAAGQISAKDVMESWMNSPGHKKNILDPLFKELGVGYLYDKNTEQHHFWVQLFRR